MLDRKKCVRCYKECILFEYEDAEDYENFLLEEGIAPEPGDLICDDCAEEII